MRHIRIHALVLAPILAITLLGACGDDESTYERAAARVCVDSDGNRIEDRFCPEDRDTGLNGIAWFYILSTLNQPAIGTQVVHNTYYSTPKTNPYAGFTRPKNADVYSGIPKTGYKPAAGSTGFTSSKKINATAPKVIVQQPKPMYQPKPGNNPPPKAPAPAPRPPAPRPVKVGR